MCISCDNCVFSRPNADEELANANYLDTLDLVLESEINHWTSHVQHFFARSAWTHVAMIIRDPPHSVLKAYGLLKYAREMPEHAHLFVFEAVRPNVRLTPLREYMRYKQDISAYKVIGVRKLHMDRKRGINWPELEQFMIDLSKTKFVVGPLAMVKANYQLNADTIDELASVNAIRSATLPLPYSRHFLKLIPRSLCEQQDPTPGEDFVLDIAATGGPGEDVEEDCVNPFDKKARISSSHKIDNSYVGWNSSKRRTAAELKQNFTCKSLKSEEWITGNWNRIEDEDEEVEKDETAKRAAITSISINVEATAVGSGSETKYSGSYANSCRNRESCCDNSLPSEVRSSLHDAISHKSRLSILAMRRARLEEDLQDTPGIFCSQMTAMTYKVAGVMYREYEHPLVRGSANYTPHDWGDDNDDLQLGLRFGAWHSKDVIRIRADNRFALRRLRKQNYDGVGEIVSTPFGPGLLLDHRPALEREDKEGFAVVRMCHFGAIAWFPVSQIYPESSMTVQRCAYYNCREQYAWWLPFEEGGEFDYTAKGKGKHWHAVRD